MIIKYIKRLSYVSLSVLSLSNPASAGAIDCTVALCLPSGFPTAACAAAQTYAFNRMRRGKPPFGICEGSGFSSATAGRPQYYCPKGKLLYKVLSNDNRNSQGTPTCASGVRLVRDSKNGPTYGLVDPVQAMPLNFAFEFNDGNGPQYFYGNYNTGFSVLKSSPYANPIRTITPNTGNSGQGR